MNINVSTLEAQPFLQGLSPRQLELLAENSMLAEFQAGDVILNEGDSANRFYLILDGEVELESQELGSEAVRIQSLGKGDVLGWSWLFPPYNWHFDARAVVPTRAIFFYGTRLRELCGNNHDLGFELMMRVSEIIIKRLQAARRELAKHKRQMAELADPKAMRAVPNWPHAHATGSEQRADARPTAGSGT